jgi:acylpyruvate hydrolase
MRYATVRVGGGATKAVRIEEQSAIVLDAADVGELLTRGLDAVGEAGQTLPVEGLDYAPLIVHPEKVVCLGLNYATHVREMGRDLPTYPTLFAKYPRTLIGAYDDVMLPPESQSMDWEAELGVIMGSTVRRASTEQARAAIAGFTVVNDVTARDWQNRTLQWMQGKNFEATTPIGPWLVLGNEDLAADLSCEVDGEVMQQSNTSDLVFDPVALVEYISTIMTLVPGDVIVSGTPGGVGHARKPPRYLYDGAVLTTRIGGIGECRNVCRADKH